jgi:hypothetical protein
MTLIQHVSEVPDRYGLAARLATKLVVHRLYGLLTMKLAMGLTRP